MSKRKSRSFSTRLTFGVMSVTALFFLSVMAFVTILFLRFVGKESERYVVNILDATVEEVNLALSLVETASSNMVWTVSGLRESEESLYQVTEQMVLSNPHVIGSAVAFEPYRFCGRYYFSPYSYLVSDDGVVAQRQLGNDDYDYFNMEWFTEPKSLRKPVWSEPYYDRNGADRYMTTYSMPLFDRDSSMYAVFTADLSLDWLVRRMQSLKPFSNSYSVLISSGCQILGGYPDDEDVALTQDCSQIYHRADLEDNAASVLDSIMASTSGVMSSGKGHNTKFIVYDRISNGWSLAIISPYKDVFMAVAWTGYVLVALVLTGLLLMFVVCRIAIRRISSPLTRFSKCALSIADGDFNTAIPEVATNDEFHHLRESMLKMQNSLNAYIEDLRTTTAAKERIESELTIARDIQMNMVPHSFPDLGGGRQIYAILNPARQVGGDLYDVFLRDGVLYFCVGDVSGKGVGASLIMANTKSAYSVAAGKYASCSIGEILSVVNDSLCGDNDNMFVTMFAGRIDLSSDILEYSNGGHNPVLFISPEGKASFICAESNIAAGVLPGYDYLSQRLTFVRGSRLVIYTDGVTEAENSVLEQFGSDRLLAWAESLPPDMTAQEACRSLRDAVSTFTAGFPQNDDITIMVINC